MPETGTIDAARQFAAFWKGKGYERGQTQPFWIDLLRLLGVAEPERGFIEFEDKAHIDAAHGFIDGYLPATHVLVEQKSLGKNLRAGIPQSDGSVLSPFQQAKRYAIDLPYSRRPRWVVTCNFAEFLIYDMERPNAEPESLLLENLPNELYRLKFLTDTGSETIRREEEISKAAGEVVGQIYDALLKQYEKCANVQMLPKPNANSQLDTGNTSTLATIAHASMLASLNELCVRLVFLLYAEDADVFQTRLQFHDYLKQFPASKARRALIDLFKVLDTPLEQRDPYLEADLAAFPYVNGGLFRGEIEIPPFNDEILDLVLRKGSEEFDWSGISPVIFGAVFESTLNPETRRSGGMHYTSVANIHKVIDPLFLDDLTRRVNEALGGRLSPAAAARGDARPPETMGRVGGEQPRALTKNDRTRLLALQSELASLTFLDPACGSGNFLTETYVCLRRLENRIIAALQDGQGEFDLEDDSVKVSISQFHGIEINDFAVKVARTALWIAEHQMLRETASLLHRNLDFLPLRDYAGIVEGNALGIEWQSILNAECRMQNAECGASQNSAFCIQHSAFSFIIGNPPFSGARWMGREQKEDVVAIFGKDWPGVGDLDYVCCWFKKAADYMATHPATHAAFVSTNSITQGGAPANLWKPLFAQGASIDFAHRTFRWDSESNAKAHVHCVIVGFSCDVPGGAGILPAEPSQPRAGSPRSQARQLFDGERVSYVPHINAYLLPGPDVFVEGVGEPLCAVPETGIGNKPIDGGNYLFTDEGMREFLKREPAAARLFRPWLGGEEFINGKMRHCLWLGDCEPSELRALPECMKRIQAVRDYRLASKSEGTRKLADRPTRFHVENMPKGNYIVIPEVSSERRRYIPIGFLSPDVLCSNKLRLIPDATLYHFGVLTSNVHMAWMRAVCGRLETRYSYSVNIVYNTFPWPVNPDNPVNPVKEKISATAQAILDARAAHPTSTLADLYDELTMPPDLRRAHQENDRAVMAAYGFSTKMAESECVAELFKRYLALATRKGAER